MAAKKTDRRVKLINRIIKAITNKKIYRDLPLEYTHESEIKHILYGPLKKVVRGIVVEQYDNMREATKERKVYKALRWERSKK